jgi:hypothetical protein
MNSFFTEERLVSMTLVNGKTVHRCMTIATSLQEALQRARMHYKQPMLELNGWGSRRLPVESRLIGGGYFIRSSRDEGHRHSLSMISSVR